jgi:hypothetical protein
MVTMFAVVATELGLRLRDPALTVEHLQLAGGLFVQSLALRNVQVQTALGEEEANARGADDGQDAGAGQDAVRHVDRLLNATVPGPGLHGGTAPWSLAALGYLGMVDAFVELDPGFVPPAASQP